MYALDSADEIETSNFSKLLLSDNIPENSALPGYARPHQYSLVPDDMVCVFIKFPFSKTLRVLLTFDEFARYELATNNF